MDVLFAIALACYALGFVVFLAFALVYLGRSQFLPYHAIAVGVGWHDVDARMRVLLLALLKVIGSAWLALAIVGLCAVYAVFTRVSGFWPLLALQVFALMVSVPPLLVAMYVRKVTHAPTPVISGAAAIGLCTLGFVLAVLSGQFAL